MCNVSSEIQQWQQSTREASSSEQDRASLPGAAVDLTETDLELFTRTREIHLRSNNNCPQMESEEQWLSYVSRPALWLSEYNFVERRLFVA